MTGMRSLAAALSILAVVTCSLACSSSSAGSRPDGGGGGAGGGDAGGGDATSGDASGDAGAAGDAGGPLVGPAGSWTWVDVAGTACDDGSMTGVGINPAPGGSGADLLVFLMGGGACWDANTCLVLNTATHGPYGSAQLASTQIGLNRALDRVRPTNPFRGFNYVFIPYCTGDLHAGSNVATYDVLGPHPYHHVGRLNVQAMLARIQATWPDAARVVVSGASAGGFGATLNYDLFRRAYPNAQVSLLDDSGPLLETASIPSDQRAAWRSAWHIGDVVDPLCPDCMTDMSLFYPALASLYPNDRMALLSSLQDQTIRTYFLILLGPDFETALRKMISERIDPLPRFHTFLIPGESHTMLGQPDTFMAGGVLLETWMGQMVNGDPAWASAGP